jgi:hypothetical protein
MRLYNIVQNIKGATGAQKVFLKTAIFFLCMLSPGMVHAQHLRALGAQMCAENGTSQISFADKSHYFCVSRAPMYSLGVRADADLGACMGLSISLHSSRWGGIAFPPLPLSELPSVEPFESARDVTARASAVDYFALAVSVSKLLTVGSVTLRLNTGPVLGYIPDGTDKVFYMGYPVGSYWQELRSVSFNPLQISVSAGMEVVTSLGAGVELHTGLKYLYRITDWVASEYFDWSTPHNLRMEVALMLNLLDDEEE